MGPLALLLITLLSSCTYSRDCNNNYECQLQVISDTGDVYCNGYFSCFQALSIASTFFPGAVNCHGSHSCYEVTTITAPYDIYCSGLYSCAFAQNINSEFYIVAHGAYSMYGIMNGNTISGSLNVHGYLACYDCTHNVDGHVAASAALALQNSYISITRSAATIYIHLDSYLTLYDGE
eukprot:412062_1